MVVHPSVPAKNVTEFIAHAKANPGKVNYASAGNGKTIHLNAELFKMMTGTNLVHVPYRGGAPALVDMISGQVQVMFDNLPTSMEHIKSGKLRALAVTVGKRWFALPDVPTVGETVPGFETSLWYGIVAPSGTPPEIVNKLHQTIATVLADPKMVARLAELGGEPMPLSPADFGKLIVDDTEKWAKVIKGAGLNIE